MRMESAAVRLIKLFFALLGLIGVIFLAFLFPPDNWLFALVGSVLLLTSIVFFWQGWNAAQQEERALIERFGSYDRIEGPGLFWIIPFSRVEEVRAWKNLWEEDIKLFPDDPSIDFRGGGSSILDDPRFWIRTKNEEPDGLDNDPVDVPDELNPPESNVYRSVYGVDDWKTASRKRSEIAFRSVLNNLTVEEALALSSESQELKPSSSFLKRVLAKMKREAKEQGEDIEELEVNWLDFINTAFPELRKDLARWGLEITEVTLTDFDWSSPVKQGRVEVFESERQIEVAENKSEQAKHRARAKAKEIAGQYAYSKQVIVQHGGTKKEAREVAPDLIKAFASKDVGQLYNAIGKIGGENIDMNQIVDTLASRFISSGN